MDSDSSFSQQQPVSKRKKSSLLVVAGSLGFVGALFWPFLRHGLRRTAPYVAASDSLVAKQVEAAKLLWKTDEAVMCDLGSGDGELVLAFASAFPQAKCIGVENNPWLTWLSRYRAAARRLKNASFQTGDLYKLPISNCNMVLACLVSGSHHFLVEQRMIMILFNKTCFLNWKPNCYVKRNRGRL